MVINLTGVQYVHRNVCQILLWLFTSLFVNKKKQLSRATKWIHISHMKNKQKLIYFIHSLTGVYGKKRENSRRRYPDHGHTSTVVFSCTPSRDCEAWNLSPEVPAGVARVNALINRKEFCEECFAVWGPVFIESPVKCTLLECKYDEGL